MQLFKCVYVIATDAQDVAKVGVSKDVTKRLVALSTSNAAHLNIVFTSSIFASNAAYQLETCIKHHLKELGLHLSGEWFRCDGDAFGFAQLVSNLVTKYEGVDPRHIVRMNKKRKRQGVLYYEQQLRTLQNQLIIQQNQAEKNERRRLLLLKEDDIPDMMKPTATLMLLLALDIKNGQLITDSALIKTNSVAITKALLEARALVKQWGGPELSTAPSYKQLVGFLVRILDASIGAKLINTGVSNIATDIHAIHTSHARALNMMLAATRDCLD